MIIEVGQVWKKPNPRRTQIIVHILEVGDDFAGIKVNGGDYREMSLVVLKESLTKFKYVLLSDLTKALL